MINPERLRKVASHLRGLVPGPVPGHDDVAAWDAQAARVYDHLVEHFPDVPLPIQVMHYVHDSDIRMRDPDYRTSQVRTLEAIIADLERGVLPPIRGITVSMSFPGLLVLLGVTVALVVVAVRGCA